MKHLIISLIFLCTFSFSADTAEQYNKTKTKEPTVYICTGSSAECYHSHSSCRGLNRCRGGVKAITLSQAEKMGRRPCKICY